VATVLVGFAYAHTVVAVLVSGHPEVGLATVAVRVVPVRLIVTFTGPVAVLVSFVSAKNTADVGVAVTKAFSPLAVVHALSVEGHDATPSWVYSVRTSDASRTWFVTVNVFWTSALCV
jgi:hypothetical protein